MNTLTLVPTPSLFPSLKSAEAASAPVLPIPKAAEKNAARVAVREHAAPSRTRGFTIDITIDAAFTTRLRHLIMGTCGELVSFIRIQPARNAQQAKVCLCLTRPAVDLVMDAVMRNLPGAQFGRIAAE